VQRHTEEGEILFSAIVLVRTVPCQECLAYNSIRSMEGIKKLYTLFGDYDFLVIIDTVDRASLKSTIKEIEMLNSVISVYALLSDAARTHLCFENREAKDVTVNDLQ